MSKSNIKLITTSDGSHSLYHEELRETYHSTHGALTESQHVFMQKGVEYQLSRGLTELRILEVGFGTGLNALLVYHLAKKRPDLSIHFQTLEPFPLASDLYQSLNYTELFDSAISREEFMKLHELPLGEQHTIIDNFTFTKEKVSLQDFRTEQSFNLVFYDAFAPNKQSEMWELDVLGQAVKYMKTAGVLTTYCAQGQFKRNLIALGLQLESLDGPPGKKEMVRATKS